MSSSNPIIYLTNKSFNFLENEDELLNENDAISRLPEEIICYILDNLSLVELAKTQGVSKKWRRISLTSPLWQKKANFPSFKVLDGSDWARHVKLSDFDLSIKEEPPVVFNSSMLHFLNKTIKSLHVKDDAGCTLLTIPKNLSIKKMIEIIRSGPFPTNNIIQDVHRGMLESDIEVNKTYRVLISNNILEDSQNCFIDQQDTLLEIRICRKPKVLEMLALLVMTYLDSKQRLYNGRNLFSICEYTRNYHILTAGFAEDGPRLEPVEKNNGFGGAVIVFSRSLK